MFGMIKKSRGGMDLATALKFENVTYRYTVTKGIALKDINLAIEEGEFVGIVGTNASGKSTFCRAAVGLIPHSFSGTLKGNVFVKGLNTAQTKVSQLSQHVGMVFSDPEAQMSQATVWEEIAFGPANLGVPKNEILQRVELVMDLLKIEKLRNRSPFTLSGGEQQKVAIASVLVMQPDILVLDEPTSNLDPLGTKEVFAAVKKLNEEKQLTVVMVEHEIELLAEYAGRIVLLDKGQIKLDGSPREVFRSVETFQEIGLNVPQVTEFAHILDRKYKSWGNRPYPVTVDEAYHLMQKTGS